MMKYTAMFLGLSFLLPTYAQAHLLEGQPYTVQDFVRHSTPPNLIRKSEQTTSLNTPAQTSAQTSAQTTAPSPTPKAAASTAPLPASQPLASPDSATLATPVATPLAAPAAAPQAAALLPAQDMARLQDGRIYSIDEFLQRNRPRKAPQASAVGQTTPASAPAVITPLTTANPAPVVITPLTSPEPAPAIAAVTSPEPAPAIAAVPSPEPTPAITAVPSPEPAPAIAAVTTAAPTVITRPAPLPATAVATAVADKPAATAPTMPAPLVAQTSAASPMPMPTPTTAPAAPLTPDARIKEWEILLSDRTLFRTMRRWSEEANYQLFWQIDRDFPIEIQVSFQSSFRDAVHQVMQAVALTDFPLQASFNNTTRVLRVTRHMSNGQ